MGMMEQMTAPQEMPMQGGMMEGAAPVDPQQSQRFNGVVQTDEGPIEVKNGVANVDGQQIYVSDDGKYAVNVRGNIIAIIQNGKAMPVTPEIIDQLKQAGVVQ